MKPLIIVPSCVTAAILLGIISPMTAREPTPDQKTTVKKPARPSSPSREQRRRALELLGEAELALEAGQEARALSLAREAQRLYPRSKAIVGFLAAIQPELTPVQANSTAYTRTKAHLAAALSRSQTLIEQRRYTEALDLLNGIIEASKILPSGFDVSLYRDLARRELAEYRLGVQTGRIRPSLEVAPSNSSPTPRAPVPEFPDAPSNAYRLARIAGQQVPAWYTRIKTALRRPMSVDYRAMPLGLVLDDIEQVTGVSVTVDKPVQAARTTLTAVVDLRVSVVPAEAVLALATHVAGCEYVLLDKGIVITTHDKAGDYMKQLPDALANHWARARYLFPDLYLEAMASRPLPEVGSGLATPQDGPPELVPSYLRSGKDLLADIEQLIQ